MSRTTQDADEFEEKWKNHTSELSALWNTLPEEEIPVLKQHIDGIEELIELAADELRDEESG